jgi:hypothetical protein
MRTLIVVVLGLALSGCAFLLSGITFAYSGTFYTTGKEFYEGCWQRKAKEGNWKLAEASTPSEAAFWATCTPLVVETMNSIGFALSSSEENASVEMKALVGFELSLKVGDGGNREGGISWGCLTPPLLHRRSDMPCPKITSSS